MEDHPGVTGPRILCCGPVGLVPVIWGPVTPSPPVEDRDLTAGAPVQETTGSVRNDG